MGLNVIASVKAEKDLAQGQSDMAYFKAVDKDGKDIVRSKAVLWIHRNGIKAGSQVEIQGGWGIKAVMNMENFAKIIFITKDEYDKK